MQNFVELGLHAPILSAVAAEGYDTPTSIQSQAIPHVMQGRDLIGIAATGTGKTAAFALPILHRLAIAPRKAGARRSRVLVLSPTRELTAQIADSFRIYGREMGIRVATVVGGVGFGPQVKALAGGVDVLVATPGRLLDHLDQRTASLEGVEIVVLDEADHMLDLGFMPAIRKLIARLPRERQTLFFSATMPTEIRRLATDFLDDPVEVAVVPQSTPAERIDQRVIFVEKAGKSAVLARLLREQAGALGLVFTRTKRGADRLARSLAAAGIEAAAIHGNRSQSQRVKALEGFRSGKIPVLVATDVAARGIDVDGVALVVNYDLPNVPETYIHRIGRTARAGAEGVAVALCTGEERPLLKAIEKLMGRQIPGSREAGEPSDIEVVEEATPKRARRPGRGRKNGQGQQRAQSGQNGQSAQNGRPKAAKANGQRRAEPRGGQSKSGGQATSIADMPFLKPFRNGGEAGAASQDKGAASRPARRVA